MKQQVEVRDEFQRAPFFENMSVIEYEVGDSFEELIRHTYFLFDMKHHYSPWDDIEHSIVKVLNVWKEEKTAIGTLFRNRNRKAARQPIIHFAAHILSIVHWLNETPVINIKQLEDHVKELQVKPVNFTERYVYIIEHPDHYHAFIQLVQLYEEMEKLYAKTLLMKKRTSSR
ncbi:GTPase [Bacillus manliponensis]|uniref:GTPase n=1 Tax=Bacillus manliponensis TaxID=574376 RepID=A0A073K287_9BACI|nr:hypothetical protein [Bacillus manliponensis]KEK20567.1 GTPase [Bacillus manliponensis]